MPSIPQMLADLQAVLPIMTGNTKIVEEAIVEFGEEADTLGEYHERIRKFIDTELERVVIETIKYKLNVTDEYPIEEDFNVFEMIMMGLEYCEDHGALGTSYPEIHKKWFVEGNLVSSLKTIVSEIYRSIEF